MLQHLLKAFIDEAASRDLGRPGRHIRYAQRDRSTHIGSVEGRRLWESGVGQHLEAALIATVESATAEPKPSEEFRRVEVRGRVASFVDASLVGSDREAFVQANTQQLLEELTSAPVGLSSWLLAGPRVDPAGLSLFGGRCQIRPANPATVSDDFLGPMGGDWLSLPDDTSAIMTTTFALPKRSGATPDWNAVMQAEFVQGDVTKAMWLLTGHRPRRLIRWSGELARFPAFPAIHEATSVLDSAGDGLAPSRPLDEVGLSRVALLLNHREWLEGQDEGFDDRTSFTLRAAFFLLDAADRALEGPQLLVHAYSILEGLLTTFDGDEESLLPGRASALLGSTRAGQRVLRRRLGRIRELRNTIAHGTRPDWQVAMAAAGLDTLEPDNLVDRYVLENELRRTAREILRCGFGCFLLLTSRSDPETGRSLPVRSKDAILKVLDQARDARSHENAEANQLLANELPDWLRDPLGRIP